ncbi:MAG: FAD:protein FMN transferase [Candidatus Kryptonium sp.]
MDKIVKFVLLFFAVEIAVAQGVSYYLMGTYAYIELPKEILNYTAYRYLRQIEISLSDYIDSSDVSKINLNAGKRFVKVSDITIEAIKSALDVSRSTNGAFDITVGALTINAKRFKKISEDSARKLINFRDIVISGDSVMLLKEGMAIDLGGIGKGFAIEKVFDYLKTRSGFISIGGDMKIWGHKRTLAVKDPIRGGTLVQMVNSGDVSISTSGNYLRKHIETGDEKIVQITVAHKNATLADAYATALFAMSKDLRDKFLSENNDVGVLMLYNDGSIFVNDRFREFFDVMIFKGGVQDISKTKERDKK